MSLIATATACLAGALLGGSSVAQRRGMPDAAGPARPLLPALLRSGWWWAGTLASLAGLGLQILALTLGSIIAVQTALAGSVVWTTLVEWALLGRRPTARGWAGMGLVAAGLAATLLALDPTSGSATAAPGPAALLGLGAGAAVAMLLAVSVARLGGTRDRESSGTALLLALATGIGYGVTAVQLKTVGVQLGAGLLAPLTHPALYLALLLGPAAVLLSQHALQRGRLVVAVVSLILVVDPVVGLLAGVGWFGEQVTTTAPALIAAGAGVAALLGGLRLLQTAAVQTAAARTASVRVDAPRGLPTRACVPVRQPAPEVAAIAGATGSRVTATRFVLDGWPVHIVIHDREGGWRVLGEQTFQPADERPTQWATLVDLDPSLSSLPPLPYGTLAHRPAPDASWVVVAG